MFTRHCILQQTIAAVKADPVQTNRSTQEEAEVGNVGVDHFVRCSRSVDMYVCCLLLCIYHSKNFAVVMCIIRDIVCMLKIPLVW